MAEEKRIKWRLKRGDNIRLLLFLKTVGLLGSAHSLFIHSFSQDKGSFSATNLVTESHLAFLTSTQVPVGAHSTGHMTGGGSQLPLKHCC